MEENLNCFLLLLFGNDFLNITPKAQYMKERTGKKVFINIKNFYTIC
jgi:hypothetical protein